MRPVRASLVVAVVALCMTLGSIAQAAPAKAEAKVEAELPPEKYPDFEIGPDGAPRLIPQKEKPWIRRWAPWRHTLELGLFGGVFIPSEEHDLYEPRTRPAKPMWRAAPDFGLRLGYFFLKWLGAEVEFSGVAAQLRTLTNDPVFVYGFRGHGIAQLPYWRITPFVLGGYGMMGVKSNALLLGDDIDPTGHYGVGVKLYINKWLALRTEFRHLISAKAATQESATHHFQVLGGLSVTFRLVKPKPPPPPDPDRDKDGFLNDEDDCPDTAGIAPDGCPAKDTDGDGFIDREDKCPKDPEDKDGHQDDDGCSEPDNDDDEVCDPWVSKSGKADTYADVCKGSDKCPDKPETVNNYQDDDGCPDVIPEPVKEFTGVIEGIVFEFRKADIRPESKPKLDKAIKVLREFEDITVEISGHTDNIGTEEFNNELSRKRAESVKQYLVDGGVDSGRISTRGAGPNEPIADNDTDAGRAKNRRIEFKVVKSSK